ncbi:hypothetical protein CK203_005393 [Vitis vinifera]|uniref:Uncharacterized protein n=1 Tax=Vitis vinifera TaxID=29760 RepID=A0A438KEN6_VITVI|nr:hypothetical protein CK203_005393 [Vitis vinifera]
MAATSPPTAAPSPTTYTSSLWFSGAAGAAHPYATAFGSSTAPAATGTITNPSVNDSAVPAIISESGTSPTKPSYPFMAAAAAAGFLVGSPIWSQGLPSVQGNAPYPGTGQTGINWRQDVPRSRGF